MFPVRYFCRATWKKPYSNNTSFEHSIAYVTQLIAGGIYKISILKLFYASQIPTPFILKFLFEYSIILQRIILIRRGEHDLCWIRYGEKFLQLLAKKTLQKKKNGKNEKQKKKIAQSFQWREKKQIKGGGQFGKCCGVPMKLWCFSAVAFCLGAAVWDTKQDFKMHGFFYLINSGVLEGIPITVWIKNYFFNEFFGDQKYLWYFHNHDKVRNVHKQNMCCIRVYKKGPWCRYGVKGMGVN